jgi:nicotinamide riboside transporter PnuC
MVKINFKTIKWISVVITIIAALSISLRMTNIVISYYIFLVGHTIMAYILYKEKDWSLFFMNMVWVLIDVIGIVKWS